MGHSEDYIRNKMYELEKQKVEIEKNKLKVLSDIGDFLSLIEANIALRTKMNFREVDEVDIERIDEFRKGVVEEIAKRWSE